MLNLNHHATMSKTQVEQLASHLAQAYQNWEAGVDPPLGQPPRAPFLTLARFAIRAATFSGNSSPLKARCGAIHRDPVVDRIEEEAEKLNENIRGRMFTEGIRRFNDLDEAADFLQMDVNYFDSSVAQVVVDLASMWFYWRSKAGTYGTTIDRSTFSGTETEVREAMRDNFFV